MADYIYLLDHRLSAAQKQALEGVRKLARAKGLTVFLVGGAVRDLTSGSPVADLDVAIQGNALKLKKDLVLAGAEIAGEYEAGQALYVRFPGGVRMEISSTITVTFPKPGKPVYKPGTILEDLRRRDFTANAMALSLNEGSYGLLMDPLNGVADIENRQLRLVSNYGFIEDPVRMVRATRLMARLGWMLEEKTATRYATGKAEEYIAAMNEFSRGYELEEIVHEEDPLRVLQAIEAEGWMQHLAPYWTVAKANVAELEKLRAAQTELQMQGIHPDAASAHFPLLTARLAAKEIAELKKSFPRPGFVAEIDGLEAAAKEFGAQLTAKAAAAPSAAWKLMTSALPEAVLWCHYSSRSAVVQAKFKSFLTEWPLVRQKLPYTLMQEMRITPELPGYAELVEKLFFELMDGRLGTVEEMKAYLEPYSPPAPPPPVSMRRARASKKDAKAAKGRGRKALAAKLDDEDEDDVIEADVDDADLEDEDDEVIELPPIPDDEELIDLPVDDVDEDVDDEEEDEDVEAEEAPVPPKRSAKVVEEKPKPVKSAAKVAVKAVAKAPAVKAVAKAPAKAGKAVPAKQAQVVKSAAHKPTGATKPKVQAAAKPVAPAKKTAPVKAVAKKVVVAKKVAAAKKPAPVKAVAKKVVPAKKAPAKAAKQVAKGKVPVVARKVAKKVAVKVTAAKGKKR